MDENLEMIIDSFLENLAKGYKKAKEDWLADRCNTFKDGRFLAYYEAKEAVMRLAEREYTLTEIVGELSRMFDAAKTEWKADKVNSFKDGRMLGCFELLKIAPTV